MKTELHGEIISFDLESGEAKYQAVLDALEAAGLSQDVAGEMSTTSAFSRACKHLKEDRSIDKLKNENKVTSFQFTKKEAEDDKIDFEYEAKVYLNRETGEVTSDDSPALAEQAAELARFAAQTRTSQDITRMVQSLFKKNADLWPIVPRKGVAYFVPERHRDFTDKVELFLKSLGGQIYRFPVPRGDDKGDECVKETVRNGLLAHISELNEVIDGWEDTTRPSTMNKHLDRCEIAAYKLEAYAEYLQEQRDNIHAALEASRNRVREKLEASMEAEDSEEAVAVA